MTRWRRARRWLLLVILLAAVCVGLTRQRWPQSKITAANAERIKPGMTLNEVEAILGGRAQVQDGLKCDGESFDGPLFEDAEINIDYCDDFGDRYYSSGLLLETKGTEKEWVSRSVRIKVRFDHHQQVIAVRSFPMERWYSDRTAYDRWRTFIQKKLGI